MCRCANVQMCKLKKRSTASPFLSSAHLHICTSSHQLYCASAILICSPALVVVIGGAVDIFGITLL